MSITNHAVDQFRLRVGRWVFDPRERRMCETRFASDAKLRCIMADEIMRAVPLVGSQRDFVTTLMAHRAHAVLDQVELVFDDHIYILNAEGTVVKTVLVVDEGLRRNLRLASHAWRLCVSESFADVLLARRRFGESVRTRAQIEDLCRTFIAQAIQRPTLSAPLGMLFERAHDAARELSFYRLRHATLGPFTLALRFDPELDGAWIAGVAVGKDAHRTLLPIPAVPPAVLAGRVVDFPHPQGEFRGHVHEVLPGLQGVYGPGVYEWLRAAAASARVLSERLRGEIFGPFLERDYVARRTEGFLLPVPPDIRQRAQGTFPATDLAFLFARKGDRMHGGARLCLGVVADDEEGDRCAA